MKSHLILALCVCIAVSLVSNITAQPAPASADKISQTNSKDGVKKLREFFFARDFSSGYDAGQKLLKQFPDDDELRMWTIFNGSRGTTAESKAALETAKSWAAAKGDSIWAQTALAITYSYTGNANEALKAADAALKIAPDNEEAIFAYNSITFRAAKYAESVAWLDKNTDKIKDRSRFFAVRALSNYRAKNKEKAFADFDAAIKLDPASVNALYFYADCLNTDKRTKEALPLIKQAVLLAPDSLTIRVSYWQILRNQTDKTDEQKQQEVAADMDALMKAKPDSPEVLLNVSIQYGFMQNSEKQNFYESEILRKFPNSSYAEPILVTRIIKMTMAANQSLQSAEYARRVTEISEARLLGDKELLEPALKYISLEKASGDKISEEWRAFIRRPQHFDPGSLTTAHLSLFYRAMYDFQMPDDRVKELLDALKTVKNEKQNNINREIADFLAVRKTFGANPALTGDLMSYARAGIEEAESDIKDYSGVLTGSDLESQAKYIRVKALQTLGFALYLDGKYDEAEKELLKASEMDSKNSDVMLTLALVYRARKEYEKAEDIYLRSASIAKPFSTSIRELYRAKNGDLQGFDDYYKTVKEKIRARIMTEVATSRIKEPKDLVPFELKTIDQKSMSSADVKGKITVINFWGVWCAPCVKEMPELQELANKYKNDSDVAILTFDTKDQLDTVKKFIEDKKYDFPVLVADSYLQNMAAGENVISFPTTFFVDKKGKISFLKIGNTGNLVEEFSLRIDILKQDK